MPELPARDVNNTLTAAEVWQAAKSLKNHKAVGADGIPVEVYKLSTPAFLLLYDLLARIWREEEVSEDLGIAIFNMVYKRKGSTNKPAKQVQMHRIVEPSVQGAVNCDATATPG